MEDGLDLDVAAMKVNQLRLELRSRGLSTKGKKAELQERLKEDIVSKYAEQPDEPEQEVAEAGTTAQNADGASSAEQTEDKAGQPKEKNHKPPHEDQSQNTHSSVTNVEEPSNTYSPEEGDQAAMAEAA